MLGSPLDLSIQRALRFRLAPLPLTRHNWYAQRPNARINPPADNNTQVGRSRTRLMKGKLRRVGFNEMLGSPFGREHSSSNLALPRQITFISTFFECEAAQRPN